MRKNIAAGNWKMNLTLDEGQKLASEVINMAKGEVSNDAEIILIPPFVHITSVEKLVGSAANVKVGAQNCSDQGSGAYTGETSVSMLKSAGVSYVVIGHSERRELFGEDNALLAAKTKAVLDGGLKPIYCCGEKLESREAEQHFAVNKEQIEEGLFGLSKEEILNVVIAYEPVWAIGTGVTASSDQAQEMHAYIRGLIAEKYDQETADSISILYGGSVKPGNAQELFAQPDVDGGLVGGASLKSRDFVDIIKSF
ncbi:triose-phosphate isomerase [Marinoscillum furvescens]|uniref:Triosephosphate isomerase n=1 Tax=Marinoscillum furvescens DSM 4134 TaxID=1122208 RepID=A0A3D9L5S4_MARFU|nr:triose-phosphate isomerase [Marinoscillum furvescens]RED98943.1 triosephosphate isomerase [Marinoscillum furvescens DSM 4134]